MNGSSQQCSLYITAAHIKQAISIQTINVNPPISQKISFPHKENLL